MYRSRGPKTAARSVECNPPAPTTRSKRRRPPLANVTSTPSASWARPAIRSPNTYSTVSRVSS
ncbi:hypothetical protein [Lentzea sp.]|uniref:hypothetical protein n=1 Tax=Lentzea sp. TaxID=56099 RepID=UPI002ED644A6